MDLSNVIKAIQEGRYDPDVLPPEGKTAIDGILKQGLVPGYTSLEDLQNTIHNAKLQRGSEYVEAASPIKTETGITQNEAAGYASVLGSMYVIHKNKDNLVKATIAEASRQKSQNKLARVIETLGDVMEGVKDIGSPRKAAAKFVVGKTLKNLLPRTRQYFKETRDLYRQRDALFRSGDPTVVRSAVQAKEIATGATAAGLGAATYTATDNLIDFVTNHELDVSEVSNADFLKLSPYEQIVYAAFDAMKEDLLFAGGASALFSTVANAGRFILRSLTGTNNAVSRDIVLKSRELNTPVGLAIASDPRTLAGPLIKGFGNIVGRLPLQSTSLRETKLQFANALKKQYFSPFTDQSHYAYLGPVQHEQAFGFQTLPVMKKVFADNEKEIDSVWESLENFYRGFETSDQSLFDVIVLPETYKYVKAVGDNFRLEQPKALQKAAETDPNMANIIGLNSPFASLQRAIESMNNIMDAGKNLTMSNYTFLRKAVNAALESAAPNDKFMKFAEDIRFTLETDLANLNGRGSSDLVNTLKESNFMQINLNRLEQLLPVEFNNKVFRANNVSEVKAIQEDFVGEARAVLKELEDKIKTANIITHRLLSPYDSLSLRSKIKTFDNAIFSQKMLANVVGGRSATAETMFDKLFRNAFFKGDAGQITELKNILGVNRVTEKGVNPGKELYRRAKARFLFDAFIRSFEQSPSLPVKTSIDFMQEAHAKGYFPEAYADQILADAVKGIPSNDRYIMSTKAAAEGLGEINVKGLNVSSSEIGEFSYDKFMKNLGITDGGELAISRLANVLADGTSQADIKQGRKDLDSLLNLLFVAKQEADFIVGDPAVMLARNITLSGGKNITSLGYGDLSPRGRFELKDVLLLPLMLKGFGYFVTNPQMAADLLDATTKQEKLMRAAGETKLVDLSNAIKAKRRLIARIVQAMTEDEELDKPRIDIDKISAEEISQKIREMKNYIPDTSFKMEMLPEDQQLRMFPEYVIYKNATPERKKLYDSVMAGFDKGVSTTKYDYEESEISNVDMLRAILGRREEQEQPIQPATPAQPISVATTPTQGIMDNVNFGALFPDDPVGELIAERRRKLMETQSG